MPHDLHLVMPQQACFVCPEDPVSVSAAPPVTLDFPTASFPWMSPVRPVPQFLVHPMIQGGIDLCRYRIPVVACPPLDLRIQHTYQFLLRGGLQCVDHFAKVFQMILDLALAGLDEGLETQRTTARTFPGMVLPYRELSDRVAQKVKAHRPLMGSQGVRDL